MEGTKIKKEDDVTITLKVPKEGTQDFYYTVKHDEPLRNLMIAYRERRKLGDYRSLRFQVDGDNVVGYQIPRELQLDKGYVIDAWSENKVLLDKFCVKKQDDRDCVTLKVKKQGCKDYYFTLKHDEPLEKLMISLSEHYDLGDYKTIQFHKYEGSRVQGHQTPDELESENEDVIDAWELSTGGASLLC